ncbi:MAG: hypothetical protein ABI548_06045 [Polyangiaceae bacterium]
MKDILCSLCMGFALVGSTACSNAGNGSTVHPGDVKTTAGTTGAAAAPGTSSGSNGGAGSGFLLPDVGGASSGTDQMCDGGSCACPPGNTTTISGYVYDPAGKNPLYNISVYVPDPGSPLPDLDKVAVACGCSQLFPAKILATGAPTDATGHFEIPCAPSGTVSLVVQTGKWRRQYDGIAVTANQPNVVPNLRLPANSTEGSLPNIAVSTGGYDSFECLPLRMGVSASEYVAGSAAGGHIHIYSGHLGAATAAGAVESDKNLWDTQAHMNEHDVVILSCEGQETTGGNPGQPVGAAEQALMLNYANGGGRVFASHFQYSWFNTGPFATAPNNIATWSAGPQQLDDTISLPAIINTTLSSGAAFPEGAALSQWLNVVGALTNNQLPIWFARNNVQALASPPSTEWLHVDPSATLAPSSTQYFSVDTPISPAGGPVCGRVVYSDVHVSGGPGVNAPGVAVDYPPAAGAGMGRGRGMDLGSGVVPTGCADHPLTPQEDALEFMLFDLSSCLVPIGQNPPTIYVK